MMLKGLNEDFQNIISMSFRIKILFNLDMKTEELIEDPIFDGLGTSWDLLIEREVIERIQCSQV